MNPINRPLRASFLYPATIFAVLASAVTAQAATRAWTGTTNVSVGHHNGGTLANTTAVTLANNLPTTSNTADVTTTLLPVRSLADSGCRKSQMLYQLRLQPSLSIANGYFLVSSQGLVPQTVPEFNQTLES